MSLFAKLLSQTNLSTPVPAPGTPQADAGASGGATELTAERVETALQAAHAEGRTEGIAAGAAAERERTAAVFASDEGKANMTMAAWMLGANPTADAAAIVAQLKTMPAQPQAAATPPAAETPQQQMQQQLGSTPLVDLNGGAPAGNAAAGADTKADINKLWDEVQGVGASKSITEGGTTFARKRTGN